MERVRRVRSLCPHCLRGIDGHYVRRADGVHLEKTCPEHGDFSVPVWIDVPGGPDFAQWKNEPLPLNLTPSPAPLPQRRPTAKGCPEDCGLCVGHGQLTCCALLEVTRRCNLRCPVCYAAAGEHAHSADPGLEEIRGLLTALRQQAGAANVQLSGGEPTVRDDLPHIIRTAHGLGFPFVQLNTNGLRLGQDAGYAAKLKAAGLNVVYLQWDGLRAGTFRTLRGADCRRVKEDALRHCAEAGLPVVLVMTLVRGVNDDEVGALLRLALNAGPLVRGLHVQPVAHFGRTPWQQEGVNAPRLTLPEVMALLAEQSGGLVSMAHFQPPGSEHALCSFSALYERDGAGGLHHVPGGSCCCGQSRMPEDAPAHLARDFVAKHWGIAEKPSTDQPAPGDGLDDFLARSSLRQRFTLSGMAFQDVYSVDVQRLRRCHIHIVSPGKGLIPFCARNLTSSAGTALHGRD